MARRSSKKKGGSKKNRGAGAGSRVRDAINGRFLKRGTEKKRPETTVIERIKSGRRRRKKS